MMERNRLTGVLVPIGTGRATQVPLAPLVQRRSATCNTLSSMGVILEQAALRGIETEYTDAGGQRRIVGTPTIARLIEAIPVEANRQRRIFPTVVVVRRGQISLNRTVEAVAGPYPLGVVRRREHAPG